MHQAAKVVEIRPVAGPDVGQFLPDVARLRIDVFRAWPYLYDGDAAYEREYLATYARSPRSVFVLALDGDRVVGASTGVPLADEVDAFRAPFRAAGIADDDVFYFGESVLDAAYRGRGLGHAFFDAREAHARAVGSFRWTAFCAVVRAPDDPRAPAGHRTNDAFWRKRGYAPRPDLRASLDWKEVGAAAPTPHELSFWLRAPGPGA